MTQKRNNHRLNMIRYRVGELRDMQSSAPYPWLAMWNHACQQLTNEHKDNGFYSLRIDG